MKEARPILIVDDERHVRSALRRLLQRMGLETAEAGSAEEALEAMASTRFSCALVDLRMPGMGGMELVRRVRASSPDLAIIVVTGHGDADDARRCTYMGVRHFVMKPWNNAELQIAIMRALDESRQDGARSEEPLRPETLRIATRVADALRMGPLPARFAPHPGTAWGDVWAGASGDTLARLATSDLDLAKRFLALARVELGRELPLEAAAGLLGPERTALFLALAAVRRAYGPEAGRPAGGDEPPPAQRGSNLAFRDGDEPELERAFLHAWMRAAAMKAAAQELPGARAEPRRAFLAGLFADLGAVALVSELASQGVLGGDALRISAEQHPSAGAWISAEWRLPGECILAAAQHHAATTLYRADPLLVLLWACEEIAVETSGTRDVAPLPYGADAARLAGMSAGVRFEVERACRAAAGRFGAALEIGPHATALRVA
jgi:FixJ family two-component response regulator